MVFRVFDQKGRPIGEVAQRVSAPVVGVGAETVLLVRGEDRDRLRPLREALLPAQHSLLRV
jgi:hypothetical protein